MNTINQQQLVLLDFVEAMDKSESLDQLFGHLESAVNQLGFDGISYTYIPLILTTSLIRHAPLFMTSSSYDQQFIDRYAEENLSEDDFTIHRISDQQLAPMNWWQEVAEGKLTRREKRVLNIMRYDHGLNNGLSIPVMSTDSAMAGFSIMSADGSDRFNMLYQERLRVLQTICRLFHDRVHAEPDFKSHFYFPVFNHFSQTEKLVVKLLASGSQVKVIAQQLELSDRYVYNVRDKLRVKFGVTTSEKMFYLAGLLQWNELID